MKKINFKSLIVSIMMAGTIIYYHSSLSSFMMILLSIICLFYFIAAFIVPGKSSAKDNLGASFVPKPNVAYSIDDYLKLDQITPFMNNTKFDVFISYKMEDVNQVRPIVDQLITGGVKPWFDEYQIIFQTDIQEAIYKGIRNSSFGIVFLNKYYFLSEVCLQELKGLMECFNDDIIIIRLDEETIDHPLFAQLKAFPSISIHSSKEDIFHFIAQKTKFKRNIQPFQCDFGTEYYAGTCHEIPYIINMAGWKLNDDKTSQIARPPGIDEVGPIALLEIGNKKLYMNMLAGRADDKLSIKSRIAKTVHHRVLQNKMRSDAASHFNTANSKCVGVHLLMQNEYVQNAYTYYSTKTNMWLRKYSLLLPKYQSEMVVEFIFTYSYSGTFIDFCQFTEIMDNTVLSLEWPPTHKDLAATKTNQAFINFQLGSYRQAEEQLKDSLHINENGNSYNELAIINHRKYRKLTEALEFANKAIALEPDNSKFQNTKYAIELDLLKGKDKSVDASAVLVSINKSIASNPDYATLYLSKAELLAVMGEKEIKWMEQFVEAKKAYKRRNNKSLSDPNRTLTSKDVNDMIYRTVDECKKCAPSWNS